MGFSGQEYWSGLPFPSPGDLPDSGTEPWEPSMVAQTVKRLSTMRETWVQSLGQEDSLEKESPGIPMAMGSQRVVHD